MTLDRPTAAETGAVDIGQLDRKRTMRVPRTRGAVSGLLLILLGAWGALVPFIGPYFDYSYRTDQTWVWTTGRGWLEVLPGAVAVLGGWLVMVSKNRLRGSIGGWLAVAAGAWFIVGQSLATVWHLGDIGAPLSGRDAGRAAAQLGYFYGLGAVIVFLAAFALGRLAVVGVRDLMAAQRDEDRAAEAARLAEVERQRALDEELRNRQLAEREAAERTAAERGAADRSAADREATDRRAAEPGAGSVVSDRVDHERQQPGTAPASAAPAGEDRVPADRGGRYDPNDGRNDGFGHAPAHSADRPDVPVEERNPYDPRA